MIVHEANPDFSSLSTLVRKVAEELMDWHVAPSVSKCRRWGWVDKYFDFAAISTWDPYSDYNDMMTIVNFMRHQGFTWRLTYLLDDPACKINACSKFVMQRPGGVKIEGDHLVVVHQSIHVAVVRSAWLAAKGTPLDLP